MIFQIVLGITQVLMSIYILSKYNGLEKKTKLLFKIYMTLTITVLSIIGSGVFANTGFIAIYLVIPMLLAFFHLYITYQIKIS